jgi:outer membrane protein TolC
MIQKIRNGLNRGKQRKVASNAVSRRLLPAICSILFVASLGLHATEGLDIVLMHDEAVATALHDNPSLAQIRSRYQALSEVPSQVGTLPDPTININAMNFPTDSFDRSQEPMTQVQIGFSQMIPFPGKLSLKKEAAEFEAIAAGHSVQEATLQLRSNVSTKWWQTYYLDRALETVQKNQALLRQFITVAKTKYETGEGLQQDVLLAQLELSKLLDQEIQLIAMRRMQAIELNVLMDQLPSTIIELPTQVSTQMPTLISEESLGELAGNERARLKQMQSNIESAQARLKLAKRDYYPDFMVGMTYGDRTGINTMPSGGDRADFASLMIGIKVPLYAKRKQAKAVAQRNSEVDMSRYALRDEKSNVLAQVSKSITDYQRAKQQFSLFESGIIPQAQQTVSSMLAGYQVNEVDFLNLVRSQITLFNYELQYWKALSEANQALARLEAAVGEESIYEQ